MECRWLVGRDGGWWSRRGRELLRVKVPQGPGRSRLWRRPWGATAGLREQERQARAAKESAVCLRPCRVTSAECSCGVALCPDGQMPQDPGMVFDFCFFPIRSYRPGCCLSTVTRTGLW